MKLYLGGAEKSSFRSMLLQAGVQRFALNFTHFRVPTRKELVLADMFNGGEILVYTSIKDEDWESYDRFIRDHGDDLTVIVGRPDYNGDWLGSKYAPIWNDPEDLERLAWLCQKYPNVAIADSAINGRNLARIRSLQQRWGTNLIGLTSKADHIEAIPWASVMVSSWTSTIRFGETQVFDGHGIRRYPTQQKESARKRHRPDIIRLGVSYADVIDDDVNALGALSITSWLAWEEKQNGVYDPSARVGLLAAGDPELDQIAATDRDSHHPVPADAGWDRPTIERAQTRHESERVLLPGVGLERIVTSPDVSHDDQGEQIEVDPQQVSVIRRTDTSIRGCDTCYLAARCPGFQEGSTCAFSLPVEIRTKDQLQAALTAMLEMQVGRIMFARFAEELEGQGLDPALSSEVERLFRLVDQFKNIADSRETMKLTVEARAGSGVLSRMFGSRAGETARQLPGGGLSPQETDALYGGVLDVD